jgi:hypothetical protein
VHVVRIDKTASVGSAAVSATGTRQTTPSGGAGSRKHELPARRPPTYTDEQLQRFATILGEEALKVDRSVQSTNEVVDALVQAFAVLNGRLKRLEQLELKRRRLESFPAKPSPATARRLNGR